MLHHLLQLAILIRQFHQRYGEEENFTVAGIEQTRIAHSKADGVLSSQAAQEVRSEKKEKLETDQRAWPDMLSVNPPRIPMQSSHANRLELAPYVFVDVTRQSLGMVGRPKRSTSRARRYVSSRNISTRNCHTLIWFVVCRHNQSGSTRPAV